MTRIVTVTLNPALDLATEVAALSPEGKMRCSVPDVDPGGGGVNVSRAIDHLGGTSTALVALGGATGQRHLAALRREGIDVHALDAPGETRQSLSVSDRATGRMYRFVMPGPEWDAAMVEGALDRIAERLAGGEILVLSGSYPPGVPEDFSARLSARVEGRGIRLVLDVSGPGLDAAAAGRGGRLAVLRMDGEEAGTLLGGSEPTAAEAAALAHRLVAAGVAASVVIGLGAEGTVGVSAEGGWMVRPPRVEVVSKTGAGDSFVGALVLGMAEGRAFPDCLALAMAAATSAVTTPATALCSAEGTLAYLAQIETEALGARAA